MTLISDRESLSRGGQKQKEFSIGKIDEEKAVTIGSPISDRMTSND